MHPQSPYKTISSQDQTKYQTTNKKAKHHSKRIQHDEDQQDHQVRQYQQPQRQVRYRQNNHINSIANEIKGLKNSKRFLLDTSRYRSASMTQKKLKRLLGQAKTQQIQNLSLSHYQERHQVKSLHKVQMKNFQKVWRGVFNYTQQYENSQFSRLKRDQLDQLDIIKQNLKYQYGGLRIRSRTLIDLQKQKKGLVKLGRYNDAAYLKKQKKRLKKQLEYQKNILFKKIVKIQEEKFKVIQTKRYNSLIMRLQDRKKDMRKKYNRDKVRLQQKYKNVLCILQHQQTLQMNQLIAKNFY